MKYKIGSSILFILLALSCQTRKMQHVGFGGDFKSNDTNTSRVIISEDNSIYLAENKLAVEAAVNQDIQQPTKSIQERKSKRTKLFIPEKRIVKSLRTHKPNETNDASGFWGFIIIVGMLLALGWGLTILGLSILQVVLIFLGVVLLILLLIGLANLSE